MISPGPVFKAECVTAARQFRTYATRALAVSLLFIGLAVVAAVSRQGMSLRTFRDLAAVGESFYYVLVSIQISLMLLVAPAAAAGAICVDKARGALAHVLVTDLSDFEIVFGKLCSRLMPVVLLVFAMLPVTILASLLGGIDPQALIGSFLVTLGVGVLGCSLAMLISVWAKRPHEVIGAVLMIWVVWILGPQLVHLAISPAMMWFAAPMSALNYTQPYWLAFAPYAHPREIELVHYFGFFAGALALSACFACVAALQVRRVAVAQMGEGGRKKSKRSRAIAPFFSRLRLRLPGPSLDLNPVLWREWRYRKPGRWGAAVALCYGALAAVASAIAFFSAMGGRLGPQPTSAIVNAFQVSIGLLLLTASAVTSLSEERARGALDVLLTTPLSTLEVVSGKWLAAFRSAPLLTIFPALVVLAGVPLSRAWSAPLLALMILAYAAGCVSLGLLIATWIRRTSLALVAGIVLYLIITVGAICVFSSFRGPSTSDLINETHLALNVAAVAAIGAYLWALRRVSRTTGALLGIALFAFALSVALNHRYTFFPTGSGTDGRLEGEAAMMASPWFGPGELTFELANRSGISPQRVGRAALGWSIDYVCGSIIMLSLLLLTFNSCMGRSAERAEPKTELQALRMRDRRKRAGRFPFALRKNSEAGVGELA